jgi:hypothetical protein
MYSEQRNSGIIKTITLDSDRFEDEGMGDKTLLKKINKG